MTRLTKENVMRTSPIRRILDKMIGDQHGKPLRNHLEDTLTTKREIYIQPTQEDHR